MYDALVEFLMKFIPRVKNWGMIVIVLSVGQRLAAWVVYDNKLAFSHHATDVAGGKLCNAFDLVRLHKFY